LLIKLKLAVAVRVVIDRMSVAQRSSKIIELSHNVNSAEHHVPVPWPITIDYCSSSYDVARLLHGWAWFS